MSASRSIARAAASRLVAQPASHLTSLSVLRPHSLSTSPCLLLAPTTPSALFATHSNPTSTVSTLDPSVLLKRRSASALGSQQSRDSILDLYRKICRLLPQVLKAYELQGEDSYHRALRNLRFYFENHRELRDSNVIEVLRHKAEMEIEEAMLMSAHSRANTPRDTAQFDRRPICSSCRHCWPVLTTSPAASCRICCVVLCCAVWFGIRYKTKSHVAALFFVEPQLASAARHARQLKADREEGAKTGKQLPSTFMQDFLAGTA